jgi:hypothetical protein
MATKLALTAVNLILVAFTVVGLFALRKQPLVLGVLAGIILYRTAFHAYWAGMEARYVLEAFPAVYVLAAEGLASTRVFFGRRPTTVQAV